MVNVLLIVVLSVVVPVYCAFASWVDGVWGK